MQRMETKAEKICKNDQNMTPHSRGLSKSIKFQNKSTDTKYLLFHTITIQPIKAIISSRT